MMEIHSQSIAQLRDGLRRKEFSSEEVTRAFLKRIKSLDHLYNAFITIDEEEALTAAAIADQKIASGRNEVLTGIPIAHKDIFCTQGMKTSCGSKMLANFVPPYNSTVISKFNDSGAIILGKTNMDEFAMGGSTETSFYGACFNPWNTKKVPGGSSGGSAAAIAALLAPGATGTDTGGSIRQPSSFCGITGLKPTYGRVSRFGMIAFASSLDQGGPMAKTAEDCALLMNVMSGIDPKDSTSANKEKEDFSANLSQKLDGLKIGVTLKDCSANLDRDYQICLERALTQLEKLGAELIEISLPKNSLAVPTYYVIAPAEASSNLSRFDGVRYGYRCDNPENLLDLYTRSRSEGFGEEVKRRILIGTYVLSAGYYDQYYTKAQRIRRLIRNEYLSCLRDVDMIMGPTTAGPAFDIGSKSNDSISMYLEDTYTVGANLAGLPAISIPIGVINECPVGMQLIGRDFDESRLLNVAHQFQVATDWHLQSSVERDYA